jgi:F-type H+-transporting ATPase subunit b
MLENPTFWVAVAFVLFVGLSYKKLAALMTKALDDRAAKIKAELDEARRLREEAEQVLAQYKQKQAEYMKEAEAMLAKAREDAEKFGAHAEAEMKAALDARTKNALERIAREEDKAIEDVRNHVVDIALAAARAIIVDHVGSLPQDELVKLALADIERKIH